MVHEILGKDWLDKLAWDKQVKEEQRPDSTICVNEQNEISGLVDVGIKESCSQPLLDKKSRFTTPPLFGNKHSTLEENKGSSLKDELMRIMSIQDELDRYLALEQFCKDKKLSKAELKRIFKLGDLKISEKNKKNKNTEKMCAVFCGLVDIVLDEHNQKVFWVKDSDTGLTFTTPKFIVGNEEVVPPDVVLPYEVLSLENIESHDRNQFEYLFHEIILYLRRFCGLTEGQEILFASLVVASYIIDNPAISYLPIILMFAPPERGKSRTGAAVMSICYRGLHLTEVRPSHIARYAEHHGASLFFDLTDAWTSISSEKCNDLVLNRFQKGVKSMRVNRFDAGAFKDSDWYKVFGITIIATNHPVNTILETRCIPVGMKEVDGKYENVNFKLGILLREKLTLWRSDFFDAELPEVESIPGIEARLWDISKPLLQVCTMLYPQGLQVLTDYLLDVAKGKKQDKAFSYEGIILRAIAQMLPLVNGTPIKTKEIAAKVDVIQSEKYKFSTVFVGKTLSSLGFVQSNRGNVSHYLYDRATFADICEKYSISIEQDELPLNLVDGVKCESSDSKYKVGQDDTNESIFKDEVEVDYTSVYEDE
jgi:hypothetical protein